MLLLAVRYSSTHHGHGLPVSRSPRGDGGSAIALSPNQSPVNDRSR